MTVYRTPGLRGLELWHGIARGATLYQLRDSKAEYFQALTEFLIRLQRGEAEADDKEDTHGLLKAAGFQRVVFCGGDAAHPLLSAALVSAALPFTYRIEEGAYAGRRGALRIFEEMNWRRGVALDLGQWRLKVMTPEGDFSVLRDESLLPFGRDAIDHALGRERVRNMLRDVLERAGPPDGVVLALPVAIDDSGFARSSTYPGLFGPVAPLFAELFSTPWFVLNDAVLAARGFQPHPHEKLLVVTLGFGVGGALWTP